MPIEPGTPGGRTDIERRCIDPDYAETMYDVFPGGCLTYRFDFTRRVHIALMAPLQQAVRFVSRQDLERGRVIARSGDVTTLRDEFEDEFSGRGLAKCRLEAKWASVDIR
jgi:hypothetical protein